MDFRSDTFQRAHQELSTMQNLDKNTVMSYLQNNNINPEDFKRANKNYKSFLQSGKTIQPEGTRFGRIGTRLFGEVGEDVRDIASMVAPKTVEAIGDFIPDPVKDHVNRMFDPYMGEGLGSEVSRAVADIGSFIVPGTQALKVIKAGKAVAGVKGATGIGKKAFKKRRINRNIERGVALRTGTFRGPEED